MENKIRDLLKKSGLSEVPDSSQESLIAYGLDSLTVVMLVVELETELGIKIDPTLALMENFETIEKINELLQQASKA